MRCTLCVPRITCDNLLGQHHCRPSPPVVSSPTLPARIAYGRLSNEAINLRHSLCACARGTLAIPSQMLLLLLQVLLVLTPTSGFLESTDEVSHEVCRYESMAEYRERENDREQFRGRIEYTIYWNVSISGDRKMADALADRHGFVNNGPVSCSQIGILLYSSNTAGGFKAFTCICSTSDAYTSIIIYIT